MATSKIYKPVDAKYAALLALDMELIIQINADANV